MKRDLLLYQEAQKVPIIQYMTLVVLAIGGVQPKVQQIVTHGIVLYQIRMAQLQEVITQKAAVCLFVV